MEPNLPQPLLLLSVAARTGIVLIVLIIAIRILGKRGLGEMNLLDILAILLVGNAVQNALTYGSGELAIGLVSAAALLLIDRAIGELIDRLPWLETKMFGDPVILYSNGRIDQKLMRQQGIEEDELLAAARSMGISSLDQVKFAILEENGQISVIPKDSP